MPDYYNEKFDDLWYHIPGTEYLDSDDKDYYQELFLSAFGDNPTMSRDDFFDEYGLDPRDFDWDAWREWYDE